MQPILLSTPAHVSVRVESESEARERSYRQGAKPTRSERLTIECSWRGGFAWWFFCVWTLGWDSLLVLFYAAQLCSSSPDFDQLTFTIPHVVIGVVMTYVTLVMVRNRTVFTLDADRLWVSHGPMPWLHATRTLSRAQLEQLVIEDVTWTRPPSYRVVAIQSDGERLGLYTTGVCDRARFVAHAINAQLTGADSSRSVRSFAPQ